MGKVLKVVAEVVGAVALAATGIGLGIELAAGASLTAATAGLAASSAFGLGIASVGTLQFAALGLGIVNSVVNRPKLAQAGTSYQFQADPTAGVPYVIGRAGVGGNVVFDYVSGSKNENRFYAAVVSTGPINAFEAFQASNNATTFAGQKANSGPYSGKMWMATSLGGPSASALAITDGGFTMPSTWWGSDQKLSGLAAYGWGMAFDAKVYAAGTPAPLWVVQGVSRPTIRPRTAPIPAGPARNAPMTRRPGAIPPIPACTA
ncbi:MAG: hypothetical protein WDM92_06365 [Caulobacteraceae bacterium]